MASIIYDEQMIWLCLVEKGIHLNAELAAWIGDRGYGPSLGAEIVLVLEELLEGVEVLVNLVVIFPPQHQDRDVGVHLALRLSLNKHSGILKVASKGLEVMAFGNGSIGWWRVMRIGLGLYNVDTTVSRIDAWKPKRTTYSGWRAIEW
jgi:hypothetical protein